MAGIEQGNVSNKEFMEEVARNECVTIVTVKKSKTKTKRLIGRNLIYRPLWGGGQIPQHKNCVWTAIENATSWSGARCNADDVPRNKFASSKIFFSTSAMLFATIFPPAQRACNFDISADSLWLFGIIWKQLSLRSLAIIWKATFKEGCFKLHVFARIAVFKHPAEGKKLVHCL